MEIDFGIVDGNSDIGSVTYNHSKDGRLLRRQLAREILSNTGVWADVAFLHQDRDPNTDGWKPARITVARFRRIGGLWRKQNHLNINTAKRADQIIAILSAWRGMVESIDGEWANHGKDR
jgi:hypothetical protein